MQNEKDRILIWIGAEFTHFLLAHILQKHHDAKYYAIIDITSNPKKFFEIQKIVKFEKIWFFHDEININKKNKPDIEYLKNFEKKYDISLWKFAINERIFYNFYDFHRFSSDEILKIEENSLKFFEKVLKEINPMFFLTKVPSFHHLELFKELCKKHEVKVLMLNYAKLSSKMYISEDIDKFDYIKSLEDGENDKKNFEEMKSYLSQNSPIKQLNEFHNKESKNSKSKLIGLLKFIFTKNRTNKINYNYYGRTKFNVLSDILIKTISKIIRYNFMGKNLLKETKFDVPYVYFPMSVDLERHILIDSPFYTNQIEVIRNIVKSLPIGYQLYVKENPSMVSREWRSISDYNKIMKIPNVKLFHPLMSNKKLLENANLVISIAGSSSLEAAFYEKPSLVFGNVFYELLPSVKKVEQFDKLHKLIKETLIEKVKSEDLSRFVSILEKNLFDFNMVKIGSIISDELYYGSSNVDVEINQEKVNELITNYYDELNFLSDEHLKKINQHKNAIK